MKLIFSFRGCTADLSKSKRVSSEVLPISMRYVKHLKRCSRAVLAFLEQV